ncbi:MAG: acyltransferase [Myxococcota bacterium]|nr:acyltransferase [Myxococcota bacterium]
MPDGWLGRWLGFWLPTQLRLVALRDRLVLRWLQWRHPGLEIHPSATNALAVARFRLGPGARLVIGPGVLADRRPGGVTFFVEPGAELRIEEGAWLRTESGPIHLMVYAGAHMRLGRESLLNGCTLSARERITVGEKGWIGPGTRIWDSDHPIDDDHQETRGPVHIGDCAWVASDVTILQGVRIGDHAVVGTRSLVTRDVPDHTLAFGMPARPRGKVGDRNHPR